MSDTISIHDEGEKNQSRKAGGRSPNLPLRNIGNSIKTPRAESKRHSSEKTAICRPIAETGHTQPQDSPKGKERAQLSITNQASSPLQEISFSPSQGTAGGHLNNNDEYESDSENLKELVIKDWREDQCFVLPNLSLRDSLERKLEWTEMLSREVRKPVALFYSIF